MKTKDDLEGRKLVLVTNAARALGITSRQLMRLMAAHNLPVIQLSTRGRKILLQHLDKLIALSARDPKGIKQ